MDQLRTTEIGLDGIFFSRDGYDCRPIAIEGD
jgi:hypothetical protein